MATGDYIFQGANSYGQLSLEHKEDQLVPKQIPLKQALRVKHVTGGGGHSLVTSGTVVNNNLLAKNILHFQELKKIQNVMAL